MDRQEAERGAWGDAYADTGRVFTHEDGADPLPSYVTKLFGRLVRQAGLRPIRLHDLRHGAASPMLAGGIPLAVVSKQLGHSSVAITGDVYSHLLPGGAGRQAADAMEALVRPRGTT